MPYHAIVFTLTGNVNKHIRQYILRWFTFLST